MLLSTHKYRLTNPMELADMNKEKILSLEKRLKRLSQRKAHSRLLEMSVFYVLLEERIEIAIH